MQIKDIFAKPINRDIKGVITIGDDQDSNIKQELEEYVVTNELERHFSDFFKAYAASIGNDTPNMGVWISGFFGSGKSHFLKILSYLLENREVSGKNAIDYFKDDNKIKDQMTINDMEKTAANQNDVMLFNIDSKAKNGNKEQKDAILNVFLQVFNEHQGLIGEDFWLADMERGLKNQGMYDKFQEKFKELDKQNRDWIEIRSSFAFIKGTIKNTLVEIGYLSEDDAEGFVEQMRKDYPISVESFAKLVNEYIESQPDPNYHLAFLVDEVGQYIGDSQQRMLNLQSIVEDLGTYTHGRAWVIVTSQQAIDQVTDNINGQDFSKIQGRFKTRIAMSSANVDEVIRKRLLEKTPESEQLLKNDFDNDQHTINNLISFDGEVERKKFSDDKSYADVYPFVPYQFELLQDTLTAIRENGSDGKHLANGERSMLAVFQESAQQLEERDTRTLVPFSIFFNGLDQFLDHTHKIVITRAGDNDYINPTKESNPFPVQVLKTLFMVKYVSNFDATLNNVVTLMIDSIDTDRIELENKVKEALRILMSQELVEKTTHGYEFLTDAEQDISKQISKQNIDSSDVSKAIGEFVFANSNINKKYTYPKLGGQYTFNFNQYVDDYPIGNPNHEMSIKVNTLDSESNRDEIELRRLSQSPDDPQIIIDMPADGEYAENYKQYLKIRSFLMDPSQLSSDERSQRIIDLKRVELRTLQQNANDELINSLEDADIYVNGNKVETKGGFSKRLEDAENKLIDEIYRKLNYIDAIKSDKDVVSLFKQDGGMNVKTSENIQALKSVQEKINFDYNGHNKVSYKTIIDRFAGIPYGYREIDTIWLVAKLFADAKLKVYVNGEPININDANSANQTANYFLKKQNITKVQLEPRSEISQTKKNDLKEVAKEAFTKKSFSSDEDDVIVREFKQTLKNRLDLVQGYMHENSALDSGYSYPGLDLLGQGETLIKSLLARKDTDEFYDFVSKNRDDFLDWNEDLESFGISEFYANGNMKKIWTDAQQKVQIYRGSKEFIVGDELSQIVDKINKIIDSNKPTGKVQDLKALSEEFNDVYNKEFDSILLEEEKQIDVERTDTLDYANSNSLLDQFKEEIDKTFDQFIANAKSAQTLNELCIIPNHANVTKERILQSIDRTVAQKKAEKEKQQVTNTSSDTNPSQDDKKPGNGDNEEIHEDQPVPTPVVEVHVPKHVSLQQLAIGRSWDLKTEADVDEKLAQLKKELMEQIKNNDSIKLDL
ncbi:BREX system P-loop protein BrxC [Companilactobacillus ginsenosidimutans]|uniref:ATPase n=1 Tax=Companilactobacillus ginsenosidimutans TaxID=1007676 RepID=A0A0H4QKF2_9LACO|nr:BREX system P-loop protein BrxC [Companilactobacillus ginsenosidimutans]AKP67178.1 hypothetical protein ABM34_06260 [Companilactobacillus ginsenosidimutans]